MNYLEKLVLILEELTGYISTALVVKENIKTCMEYDELKSNIAKQNTHL